MKVIAALAAFILIQAVFYMFGSFVANSFDLAEWNRDGRFMTAMFGFICGVAGAAMSYNELKEAK
jgi:hypothetical protein